MSDKKIKRTAFSALVLLLAVFVLLCPFAASFAVVLAIPARYADTYYGELAEMAGQLEETEDRKIIVLGNSNVAFGVDSALAGELLSAAGLSYEVCNLGLYGSLGTKMMTEIADDFISEGDIVIFVPEITEQSLSLYFSAEEAWRALDSDLSMFALFSGDSAGSLAGNFFGYAADKYSLWSEGETAQPSGIYARDSFDEHCDLKNYSRPYNIMTGGTDPNNPIVLDTSLYAEDFIEYMNTFYGDVQDAGAEMYYSFPPMNADSVTEESLDNTDTVQDFVTECFDFPVISDIDDYILEMEYFYDSNFHLNESGMTVRTVQLVNDIKNALGNTTKTEYTLPEKPVIPDTEIEGEGDNSDAAYFTYTQDGNYYVVSGLTEEGSARTDLTVPYQVDGLYVKSFTADVFAGNTVVESVTIQENITSVSDGSFSGCTSLKTITFLQEDPTATSVGYGLLTGSDAVIRVPDSAVSAYKNNYFWGHYADNIVGISSEN